MWVKNISKGTNLEHMGEGKRHFVWLEQRSWTMPKLDA